MKDKEIVKDRGYNAPLRKRNSLKTTGIMSKKEERADKRQYHKERPGEKAKLNAIRKKNREMIYGK